VGENGVSTVSRLECDLLLVMGTKFLYKNPIESEESSPVVFVQQREGRSMMGCEYLAMSPPGIIVDDDYVPYIHVSPKPNSQLSMTIDDFVWKHDINYTLTIYLIFKVFYIKIAFLHDIMVLINKEAVMC